MSAHAETAIRDDDGYAVCSHPRRSTIERFTASIAYWPFRILSLLIVTPLIVLGLLVSTALTGAAVFGQGGIEGPVMLALSMGGAAGLAGLAFGWKTHERHSLLRRAFVECLIIGGIVTAAAITLFLLFQAFNDLIGSRGMVVVFPVAVLATLVLDGCGALLRLRRLTAERTGVMESPLPLAFLGFGFALIACALAAAYQLT